LLTFASSIVCILWNVNLGVPINFVRCHALGRSSDPPQMTGSFVAQGKISAPPAFQLHPMIDSWFRFVWGSFGLATSLSLVAAMSSQVAAATDQGNQPSKAISGVGIMSIFLFGWIFSFVYTPNQVRYFVASIADGQLTHLIVIILH